MYFVLILVFRRLLNDNEGEEKTHQSSSSSPNSETLAYKKWQLALWLQLQLLLLYYQFHLLLPTIRQETQFLWVTLTAITGSENTLLSHCPVYVLLLLLLRRTQNLLLLLQLSSTSVVSFLCFFIVIFMIIIITLSVFVFLLQNLKYIWVISF